MPIVSVLNQKGGVGKSTLSIHIATALAGSQRVLLIDADTQGSALDWAAARSEDTPALFPVIGLPKATLHRDMAAISRGYDWVIIDGPPRVNDVPRSAIAASDVILIPVQPSPFDVWAAADIVDLINECVVHKPHLQSRILINRQFPNTKLSKEVDEALASLPISTMISVIRNRTEYAKAAKDGLTAIETEPNSAATRDMFVLVEELQQIATSGIKQESARVAG